MAWDLKIVILFLLNLFDGVLTLYAVLLGVMEVNPVMEYALRFGALGFLSIKVGLVSLCLLVLNNSLKGKKRRLLSLLVFVYALVTIWHVYGAVCLYGLSPQSIQQIHSVLEKGYEVSTCYSFAIYS